MGPCIKEESLQKAFLLLHNLSLTHKKWMSKPLTKSEEFPPKKYYTRQKPETGTCVSILTVSIFVDVSGRIALFCSSLTKRSSGFSGWGEKKGSDFFLCLFTISFHSSSVQLYSSARENIHVMQMCQQTTLLNDP